MFVRLEKDLGLFGQRTLQVFPLICDNTDAITTSLEYLGHFDFVEPADIAAVEAFFVPED